MHLVAIPLNSFTYRFRRLGWAEELSVKPPAGVDPRTHLLATALYDVSGLKIASFDEALAVVRRIPETIRWRIFVLYRGNLPDDRYYSSGGLYEAPEPTSFPQRPGSGDEGDDTQSVPSHPAKAPGLASESSAERDVTDLTRRIAESVKNTHQGTR